MKKNVNFDGAGTCWSNIIKIGSILDAKGIGFSSSFGKEVGDGKNIELWYERCLGTERLQDAFPRLFRLEENKRTSIAERGEWVEREWKWAWKWTRAPKGREKGEIEELMNRVQGNSPKEGKSDKTIWRLDDSKAFSVKALREILERQEGDTGVRTKWMKIVPKKNMYCYVESKMGSNPMPR